VHQDCLDVVVLRVTDGHAVGPAILGCLTEEGVTHLAGGFLQGKAVFVAVGKNVAFSDVSGDIQAAG